MPRLTSRLLATAILAASCAAPALADPVSAFFPGGAGKLVDANGVPVTVGTCLSLSGGTLSGTCSGSSTAGTTGTGASPVRADAYEIQTPGGGPTVAVPYYLTTYAELPGTIAAARVSMLAASGGNFQYVVHVVHGTTDTPVTGLNNVGVCNGEAGCATAQLATYASPNTVQATGANTYAVGDRIYVSFNTVGGTFTNVNFHLSVVQ